MNILDATAFPIQLAEARQLVHVMATLFEDTEDAKTFAASFQFNPSDCSAEWSPRERWRRILGTTATRGTTRLCIEAAIARCTTHRLVPFLCMLRDRPGDVAPAPPASPRAAVRASLITAAQKVAADELVPRIGFAEHLPHLRVHHSPADLTEWVLSLVASGGRDVLLKMMRLLITQSDLISVEDEFALAAAFPMISGMSEDDWEQEFDEEPGLWELVKRKCEEAAAPAPPTAPTDEIYVQRASVHDAVSAFVEDPDRTIFVLVGRSGMGKTTVVRQIVREQLARGNLAFMISSASLPTEISEISPHIASKLSGGHFDSLRLVDYVERKGARRHKLVRGHALLVAIDAVNEYNRNSPGQAPNPQTFLHYLDRIAAQLKAEHKQHVKLLVTLRPETWGLDPKEWERQLISSEAYWRSPVTGRLAHELDRFESATEAPEAFAAYARNYDIATRYAALPPLAQYQLRDPLLLRITCETYRGTKEQPNQLPIALDVADLFKLYHDKVVPPAGAAQLIAHMVASMFDGTFLIARDAIDRAHICYPELVEGLDLRNPTTSGARLHGANVIREYDTRIRFTYDRYLEYLLSTELFARITQKTKQNGLSLADVAFEALRENLEIKHPLPTAQRAFRRCLRLLLKTDKGVEVVRRLALHGETGLTLASSVMGVIAMRQEDGIAHIEALLATLRGHSMLARISGRAERRPFPVIDVVFRLIGDEEYAHWRAAQPARVLDKHLRAAVTTFHWGFTHPRYEVSAAATLYLYFLWKDPATRDVAAAISKELVKKVRRLRLWTPLLSWRARLVEHVIGLLVLALPDLVDERGMPITLDIAIDTVRRLELAGSPLANRILGLGGLIGRRVRQRFGELPNPVNLAELEFLLEDPDACVEMRTVLRALGVRKPPALGPLLAQQKRGVPNGLVLEMLAFSISAGYETAPDAEREKALDEITRAVDDAIAGAYPAHIEYALALALYHINYFGTRGDRRTVLLMQDLTTRILVVHKGKFKLHGVPYDFNIVGTFGRVRKRHARLFPESAKQPVFQFALDALAEAVKRADDAYYVYVCQNVGLLGILDDPGDAFVVLGHAIATRGHDPEVRRTVVESLTNIRALYRSRVDRWLLEVGDSGSPSLFDQVVHCEPRFNLSLFHSWYFEHLMFDALTKYHDVAGKRLIDILDLSLKQKGSLGALRTMLTGTFNLCVNLVQSSASSP